VAPANSRIEELRRRVQTDPASSAFAQLAEEYRRAGDYHEAVKWCRHGLTRHPGYDSARVTLGRALLALAMPDDAARELEIALRGSPENVAALRAMADVHEQRGEMPEALALYRRALAVARFDPSLEETVTRIDRAIASASASSPPEPPPAQEPFTDFDALLALLGVADAAPPPATERLLSKEVPPPSSPVLPDVAATGTADVFAELENDLRAFSREHDRDAEERVADELEAWLRALEHVRGSARTT
jgi:tetratricopeptide (TPR) repeat protein